MTMMYEAKKGRITKEMEIAAEKEKIDVEKLRKSIAKGYSIIFKNKIHDILPVSLGQNTKVKINVNIGTSRDIINIEEEIKKAKISEEYGADTIMDLSTGGDLDEIRRTIMNNIRIPIGTVPIYQAAENEIKNNGAIVEMDGDKIFSTIEKHYNDGVDFVTVHCGVTKDIVEKLRKNPRTVGMVSRGGVLLAAWILHNQKENPLFENYDYLLEMTKEYDAVLSLGDGLRPGGIPDATDYVQIEELHTLGRLVKKARENDVQVIVEGPGHIPINEIEKNIKLAKEVTDNAPFYVLGPLTTDIAPGYDHIVGAIGGAIAAYHGADFLCYVTPAEHLALPTLEEVKEGTIASKIAAHSVNLTRFKDEYELDYNMSCARANLDWDTQIKFAMDKEKFESIRKSRKSKEVSACSMCGNLCAIDMLKKAMSEKK